MSNKAEVRKARFWSRVKIPTWAGCWEWQGPKYPSGYGLTRLGSSRSPMPAHRAAYVICVGPIPEGAVIMHQCDNPGCVNPGHLRAGTQKQNLEDMTQKGRRVVHASPGESNGGAKLTNEQTLDVFRRGTFLGERREDIARSLGVSKAAINRICQGRHSLTRGLV